MGNDEKRDVTRCTLNFTVQIIITVDILNVLRELFCTMNYIYICHFVERSLLFLNSVKKPEVHNESRF